LITVAQGSAMLARFGVRPRRAVWVTDLHAHVLQIARDAGIDITWRAPYASAFLRSRRIQLQGTRIDDTVAYIVALHELGHLLGTPGRTKHADEHRAWDWAKDHALIWNDDLATAATQFLATYYVRRSPRRDWCDLNSLTRCRAKLAAAMGPIAVL
jgi:hypothetical protein